MKKQIHSNSLRGLSEEEAKIAKNFIFTDHPLLNYIKHPDFRKRNRMAELCKQPIPTIDEHWYDAKMSDETEDALPEEISKTLLSDAEEKDLFLKYNYLRYQIFSLKKNIAKKGKQGIIELIALYKDLANIERTIAAANLKIVLFVAYQFRNQADWNELVSEGNECLIRAIRKFDLMTNNKFSTFSYWVVNNGLIDFVKERQKINNNENQIVDDKWDFEAEEEEEEEDDIQDNLPILRKIIDKNLVGLTNIELKIIHLRFPRDGESKSRDEIGKLVGLTGESIRKKEAIIIDKLKCYMRKNSKKLKISDEIPV
jgi:RNA polymerase sigma factor (sigma-70 family)